MIVTKDLVSETNFEIPKFSNISVDSCPAVTENEIPHWLAKQFNQLCTDMYEGKIAVIRFDKDKYYIGFQKNCIIEDLFRVSDVLSGTHDFWYDTTLNKAFVSKKIYSKCETNKYLAYTLCVVLRTVLHLAFKKSSWTCFTGLVSTLDFTTDLYRRLFAYTNFELDVVGDFGTTDSLESISPYMFTGSVTNYAYLNEGSSELLVVYNTMVPNWNFIVKPSTKTAYTSLVISPQLITYDGIYLALLNNCTKIVAQSSETMSKVIDTLQFPYEVSGEEASDGVFLATVGITPATDSTAGISDLLKIFKTKIKGYVSVELDEGTVKSVRESYDGDAYAQTLYEDEQEYFKTFNLGSLEGICAGVANGDVFSMLLTGESGTGKSTAAKVIAYRCGLPCVTVNLSINIEEADLFGTMIPNPIKASADDAEFIWQDGVITRAIRNGYVVVCEELNFARAGVLGKLNSLLDENRQIELANGERIKAHKNFRLFATCNVGYEGTNRLNKALINRFQTVKVFDDIDSKAAWEIIQKRTKYSDYTKFTKVYAVYAAIKKYSKEQDRNIVISIRQLLNIFSAGRYYKNAYDAVMAILIDGAFIDDAEYKDDFVSTVMPAFDLKFHI